MKRRHFLASLGALPAGSVLVAAQPPPAVRRGAPAPSETQLYIEQSFPAEPTFKDGFQYWLVPTIAKGKAESVDMTPIREARIAITPEAKTTEGWLSVAVPTTSDPGGPAAECRRLGEALGADPAPAMQRWREETLAAGLGRAERTVVLGLQVPDHAGPVLPEVGAVPDAHIGSAGMVAVGPALTTHACATRQQA